MKKKETNKFIETREGSRSRVPRGKRMLKKLGWNRGWGSRREAPANHKRTRGGRLRAAFPSQASDVGPPGANAASAQCTFDVN
ncbi:hypothetical protein CEXT_613471 [Caerostris extrusa]|uniref:Uncharacterized protein n=1 Tax=Caerostris extrusa TaxID=172846 RepID=A0AAV4RD32_CAEEX|nr:hypothetical protein CEXT_613471 [Caerostris extrusa]